MTTTAAAATIKPQNQATGTAKRAGLDYEDVVVAALQLVETRGAEALSMRKLAAELGVTTTTIYHHVGGRDDLILALIRHSSAQQAEITIEGQNPADRIQSVSEHIWSSALDHRNVTALAHQVGATSLLAMPLELALARELQAAGLSGAVLRDALRAILMCTAGFLVVAFRNEASISAEYRSSELWSEVIDEQIDAETTQALCEPPDVFLLFQQSIRALILHFITAEPGPSKQRPSKQRPSKQRPSKQRPSKRATHD